MAGYTRQDTANNIANGNVVDADDLDSEFNAIEGAFNTASGHNHDGSAGNGAPITKVGPGQDVIISTVAVLPKTTNTLDLGGAAVQYKNAYFDGTVNTDTLTVDENASIAGSLSVVSGITGTLTGNADTATAWQTARTLTLSGDVTGSVSGIDGTGNIAVTTTVGNDSHTHTSGFITDFVEATQDVVGGMVSGNTEQGIAVTYDDSLGKLNFDVNDPVITLSGDVAGSATMTNLGNVTIATTVQPNSVTLGTDTTGNYVASLVAGTGVTLANNTGENATPTVSIGQAVATTSNVLFNQVTTTGDVIVGGNLTVSGTTTTVNTETINLADNIITLNSNEAGTPSQNAGIEVERGTAANKTLVWDEANDRWTVGSEAFVAGNFVGNLSGTATTATTLATARTIAGQSFDGSANISIAPTDLTGVTATAVELNIVDGNTSATSITLTNADRVVVNDDGTMVQVAMTDVATYVNTQPIISDADLNGTTKVEEVIEKVTTQTSTTGVINFDCKTQAIEYYTQDQTANRTINFRGDSSTTLNSMLSDGESITVSVAMAQGSTAYYLNAYQIDGVTVTPKWSSGISPSYGDENSINVYTFTIIKTASSTYTILASKTQYA